MNTLDHVPVARRGEELQVGHLAKTTDHHDVRYAPRRRAVLLAPCAGSRTDRQQQGALLQADVQGGTLRLGMVGDGGGDYRLDAPGRGGGEKSVGDLPCAAVATELGGREAIRQLFHLRAGNIRNQRPVADQNSGVGLGHHGDHLSEFDHLADPRRVIDVLREKKRAMRPQRQSGNAFGVLWPGRAHDEGDLAP